MDNHHDHHEETKPTNKWIATPILGAFFIIALIVTFLSFASGTCCGGECKEKDKSKTEEHGPVKHDTQSENEDMLRDSTTTTTADSTGTNEGTEGGGEQHEGEGHGH